eukprot:5208118-Pyramimonas_sp.AAC.1
MAAGSEPHSVMRRLHSVTRRPHSAPLKRERGKSVRAAVFGQRWSFGQHSRVGIIRVKCRRRVTRPISLSVRCFLFPALHEQTTLTLPLWMGRQGVCQAC